MKIKYTAIENNNFVKTFSNLRQNEIITSIPATAQIPPIKPPITANASGSTLKTISNAFNFLRMVIERLLKYNCIPKISFPFNVNSTSSPSFSLPRGFASIERIITYCLLYLKLFPAIWIIIAAKTLACYDKLKADERFRGKYLVGTLISVAVPVVLYALFTVWYPFLT